MFETLIDTATLAQHLDDPGWVIVDCRFDLADTAAGRQSYQQSHIPGAVFAHHGFQIWAVRVRSIQVQGLQTGPIGFNGLARQIASAVAVVSPNRDDRAWGVVVLIGTGSRGREGREDQGGHEQQRLEHGCETNDSSGHCGETSPRRAPLALD